MTPKSKSTTKPTSKPKTKQKFLRLNLDENLDRFIQSYESKYMLLSRADIVRMLLSEIYYEKQRESRDQALEFIKSLPPANHNFTEEEIFDILNEEGLN